jgi:N-acetylmuramoyl-L-alanine amidase
MTNRFHQLAVALARVAFAAGLAIGLAACGGPAKQRGLDRLYSGLSESLPRFDPSILRNRRILIDPGHGGYFRGTVGRDSLDESSVNLGVSLYLWGLLREAGADVHLTRSVDRDFLTEEDSSLAADLSQRVAIADSLEPDLLISIHHNAQPSRDPSRNTVETYYRAGDPASLDLAFAVHRHLMRNLGIDNGEVRQGNYLILRESRAPAILGESSYLTHPPVEEKLKLSKIQKLEAEAYFLGILEYFERGIPVVTCLSPRDSVYETVPELVYALEDDGGTGIDPDGISMTLNGRPVSPVVDATVLRASYLPPWDLPNGRYEASLSVRNIGGNTSAVHSTRFEVDFPPALAAFDVTPSSLPPDGGVLLVRARLLDRRGLAVADGTKASVTTSVSSDTTAAVVSDGRIEVSVIVPSGAKSVTVALLCRGKRFEKKLASERAPKTATRAIYLRDASTGRRIENASVFTMGDSVPMTGSPTGTYLYSYVPGETGPDFPGAHFVMTIEAPGYRPLDGSQLRDSPLDTLEMTPWFGGALNGLRFVIDPEAGPPSRSGLGPLGLSGAYANLQVARYLAGYLRAAGSEVWLTRTNEEVRTPEDVARITNRYLADRYVEIRHGNAQPDSEIAIRTYYFPGSVKGRRMAESVLGAMSIRLARPGRGPFETVTYPLQQTACPAIVVEAPPISQLEEELRLAESWYQREQAYAMFLGVLDHYEVTDSHTVDVTIGGHDPSNWRVTIDNTWTLVTGPTGRVVFEKLPAGSHTVRAGNGQSTFTDRIEVETGEPARVFFGPSAQ